MARKKGLFGSEDVDKLAATFLDTCCLANAMNPMSYDCQSAVQFIAEVVMGEVIDTHCPDVTEEQLECFIEERCYRSFDEVYV